LKIDIKGVTGSIEKIARVYSNDPQSGVEKLTVKAYIREAIKISPVRLTFKGKEGTILTQSVDIIAQEKKPLSLKPGDFSLTEKMTYRIEEIESGKVFKISFTNLPLTSGHFQGSLKLTTNYDEKQEITIPISGSFDNDAVENEKKQ